MGALLCWIGAVLLFMLGTGGVLVGVSSLAWAPVGVGVAAFLASWWCGVQARKRSATQLASAGAPGRREPDNDDDDDDSYASTLLANRLRQDASVASVASAASTSALGASAETRFEPLECRADASDGDDRSDDSGSSDCSSNDDSSESSSDSGSDNSSSD